MCARVVVGRPADKERHSQGLLVHKTLVEQTVLAQEKALIADVNHDRVFPEPVRIQPIQQAAYVVVHALYAGQVWVLLFLSRLCPRVMRRGGVLLAAKIVVGILVGIILGHVLGERPVAHGWFAGVSTLAVVAAINDTNGGLYMALMQQHGSPEDAGAYSLVSLEAGPFLDHGHAS
jgi:hypothetical protein